VASHHWVTARRFGTKQYTQIKADVVVNYTAVTATNKSRFPLFSLSLTVLTADNRQVPVRACNLLLISAVWVSAPELLNSTKPHTPYSQYQYDRMCLMIRRLHSITDSLSVSSHFYLISSFIVYRD
jgi:hypothetical protein